MNNLINARPRFYASIAKSASEPQKQLPEATKVFYVDFKMKLVRGQTVIINKEAA